MKKVTNESGLTLEIIVGHPEDKEPDIFLGGDDRCLTWEEYVQEHTDQYHPHVRLIREAIIQNGLLGYTGQAAQEYYFQFSDGELWGYTWRAWGDLMQSIVDKKEGYMAYYM